MHNPFTFETEPYDPNPDYDDQNMPPRRARRMRRRLHTPRQAPEGEWLQRSLNRVLGRRVANDTGFGANTRNAIRQFQHQAGLKANGRLDSETAMELNRALRSFDEFELEAEVNRSSPEYVRWLQNALNKILGSRLVVDGIAGTQTLAAIRSFQQREGLAADGIVGPITESALIRRGAGSPPGSLPAPYAPLPPQPQVPPSTSQGSYEFITVRSGVVMNSAIERVIRGLDNYFRNAKLPVTLTSAVRSPDEQLAIIKGKAKYYGIDWKYPSLATATVDNVESWRGAWDELRHVIGYEVLPPKYACSRIKPGVCKNPSPHTRGEAFDLSGANLDAIANVVKTYCTEIGGVVQILIERTNNAVHIQTGSGGSCAIEQT